MKLHLADQITNRPILIYLHSKVLRRRCPLHKPEEGRDDFSENSPANEASTKKAIVSLWALPQKLPLFAIRHLAGTPGLSGMSTYGKSVPNH
ncbi:hypothetical protein K3148_06245 [Qipengyuania aurantiaca]|uniref:Uncharacterized protein n=1 Tax=Qipengyuania aurantiaca TaxID=2867233 RepID=A0ABX8ZPT9_9SPHN|nr:hypothetical protein [Qipengyuania aurantiaca]QZD90981.1 hypothetical protein K3148_06245 [Qipengyuania aurantiaca]